MLIVEIAVVFTAMAFIAVICTDEASGETVASFARCVVQIYSEGRMIGGGVVVAGTWVLTVAPHASKSSHLTVVDGDKGVAHTVIDTAFHPGIDHNLSTTSLVLFKIDPGLQACTSPVVLPVAEYGVGKEREATAYSWGTVDVDHQHGQLDSHQVILMAAKVCQERLHSDASQNMLCAVMPTSCVGVYQRQAGMPLVADGVLFGLTLPLASETSTRSETQSVMRFTKVAGESAWIALVTGIELQESKGESDKFSPHNEATWNCDVTSEATGNLSAVDGIWQNVAGTRLFVYSAFWVNATLLRVIGTGKRARLERPWCRVWYNAACTTTTRVHVKEINEHHDMPYGALFLDCPLLKGRQRPLSVTIVKEFGDLPSNHLLIINNDQTLQPPVGLSVCMKPIYNGYNKVIQLIEFLELYMILGVELFTLYYLDASPSVSCILRHYQKQRVVELQEWRSWLQFGVESQKDVLEMNLMAAFNDCLYRHRFRSTRVAFVDFDEFIVPQQNITLVELLRQLSTNDDPTSPTGSFLFQNAYFYLEFSDDPSVIVHSPLTARLATVTKTRRRTAMLPHGYRSKYVCLPRGTAEVGNHFVWEHVAPYRQMNVPAEVATSHHYRPCEWAEENCLRYPSHVDRSAQRYQHQLTKRVAEKWTTLEKECQLNDH